MTLGCGRTDFLKRNKGQRWEPNTFLHLLLSCITMIPLKEENHAVSFLLHVIQGILTDNHSEQLLSDLLKGIWEEYLTHK